MVHRLKSFAQVTAQADQALAQGVTVGVQRAGPSQQTQKCCTNVFFKHWPKYHKNVFGKCFFDVKMYGRDLGEKTFLQNVCDDVVKTFFKHFLQHTQKCLINRF